MAEADGKDDETHAVRFSSRLTSRNESKLIAIAKRFGWLNAQGKPNLSKAINWIIDRFEFEPTSKEKRRE